MRYSFQREVASDLIASAAGGDLAVRVASGSDEWRGFDLPPCDAAASSEAVGRCCLEKSQQESQFLLAWFGAVAAAVSSSLFRSNCRNFFYSNSSLSCTRSDRVAVSSPSAYLFLQSSFPCSETWPWMVSWSLANPKLLLQGSSYCY